MAALLTDILSLNRRSLSGRIMSGNLALSDMAGSKISDQFFIAIEGYQGRFGPSVILDTCDQPGALRETLRGWARRGSGFTGIARTSAITKASKSCVILNGFESRLTNGGVEAINGLIHAAKGRARGYRTTRNFINMAYLVAGRLTHLPASPYDTTSGAVVR